MLSFVLRLVSSNIASNPHHTPYIAVSLIERFTAFVPPMISDGTTMLGEKMSILHKASVNILVHITFI